MVEQIINYLLTKREFNRHYIFTIDRYELDLWSNKNIRTTGNTSNEPVQNNLKI